MKVLEFLKKYQDEIQSSVSNEIDLDELIEELEEFNNRSYDGCKKQDTFMCPVTSFDKNMEDFCCNRLKQRIINEIRSWRVLFKCGW